MKVNRRRYTYCSSRGWWRRVVGGDGRGELLKALRLVAVARAEERDCGWTVTG